MRSDTKNVLTTGASALVVFFLCWVIYSKITSTETAVSKKSVINQDFPEPEGVKLLKDSLVVSTIPENYSNFALRLADSYVEESRYDSAGHYQELAAEHLPNEENWIRAGLTYYKAFENASGPEWEHYWASKAMLCLEKGVSTNSSPKIKRKLAELYLANDKPGEAVDLLKQVISSNPTDKESLFMMGIHAYQVSAYEDAAHYLGSLVNLDSTHVNGLYYLAISEMKLGNTGEAKVLFEKVKQLDISEEAEANVDAYLNDIK